MATTQKCAIGLFQSNPPSGVGHIIVYPTPQMESTLTARFHPRITPSLGQNRHRCISCGGYNYGDYTRAEKAIGTVYACPCL
jgi:hypothetical protein